MKQLNLMLIDLCNLLNLPTSKQDAIDKGAKMYLQLDFLSHYGGYRLVNVDVNSGGHYGAFGKSDCCSRISKKQMVSYLEGLIVGVESAKKI